MSIVGGVLATVLPAGCGGGTALAAVTGVDAGSQTAADQTLEGHMTAETAQASTGGDGSGSTASTRGDRRRERSFPLASVLIPALLALAGVLIGLWASNYTASATTDKTIAAARSQSQDEFRRDQQRSAYGQLLTEERLLTEAESAYVGSFAFRRPSGPDILASEAAIAAQTDKVFQALSVVELVGSDAAIGHAEDLIAAHDDYYASGKDYFAEQAHTGNPSDEVAVAGGAVAEVRALLVSQAREDIDAG
jgi:hypothetical protein